jgi:hypothetical protein
MNVAPSGRPERRSAAEISAEDNSDPAGASRPGPDENLPVPGVDDGRGNPSGEPDDDDGYEPL